MALTAHSNYPGLKAEELAALPPRFDETSIAEVFHRLEAFFPGKYSQPEVEVWEAYLVNESPSLVERSIRHIENLNELDWVPNLGYFRSILEEIRKQDTNIERYYQSLDKCQVCDGVTWVKRTGSLSGRPCEKCLPEAYRRWRQGSYEPLTFQDDSEFTGPIKKYDDPTPPDIRSNVDPVDEFRTAQWQDYINNGQGFDTIEAYMKAQISND